MTTKALAWIRKSKGSEDDIGLEQQRRQVRQLAEDVADEVDTLDLGVQTGFSTMTRDGTGLLDQIPRVKDAVTRVREGEFDYVAALDDRRVARDEYMSVIEYAATQGNAEFVYVREVQRDDLSYDIHRRVERHTKEEEIEKARAAIQERQERGMWQGRPPIGLEFDEAGEYLVPDEDFGLVMEALDRLEAGQPYAEIADALGIAMGTVTNINERGRRFYERRRKQEA